MVSRKDISLAGSIYCFLAGIFLLYSFEGQNNYFQTWYQPIFPLMQIVTEFGTLVLIAIGFVLLRDYATK